MLFLVFLVHVAVQICHVFNGTESSFSLSLKTLHTRTNTLYIHCHLSTIHSFVNACMHGRTRAHMQADLNVEDPVDPSVLALAREPSLTQEQKHLFRVLIQHFHLLQVPVGTQHAVVVTNTDLEHLTQIHSLQSKRVHLTNKKSGSTTAANQK